MQWLNLLIVVMLCSVRAALSGLSEAGTDAPTSAPASAPAERIFRTAHYVIFAVGVDPAEHAELLEALYARFEEFFGALDRDDRLVVRIYQTNEEYQRGLRADGEWDRYSATLAGVTSPRHATAYMWVQDNQYEREGCSFTSAHINTTTWPRSCACMALQYIRRGSPNTLHLTSGMAKGSASAWYTMSVTPPCVLRPRGSLRRTASMTCGQFRGGRGHRVTTRLGLS
jgi:hypothetical protein